MGPHTTNGRTNKLWMKDSNKEDIHFCGTDIIRAKVGDFVERCVCPNKGWEGCVKSIANTMVTKMEEPSRLSKMRPQTQSNMVALAANLCKRDNHNSLR